MTHGDSSEKCTRFAFLPTLLLTFEPTPNPLRQPVPECTCVEVCGSVWGGCSSQLGHGDYRQVVGSVVWSSMATKKPSSAPVSARLDMSKCDLQAKIHPQQITTNTHMDTCHIETWINTHMDTRGLIMDTDTYNYTNPFS